MSPSSSPAQGCRYPPSAPVEHLGSGTPLDKSRGWPKMAELAGGSGISAIGRQSATG